MNGLRLINNLEEYLVAIFLGAMTILNFGNVLSRYLLKASWSFTGEILIILFVWTILLAAAIAYKRSEHLGFPLIFDLVFLGFKKVLIVYSAFMYFLLMIVLVISVY